MARFGEINAQYFDDAGDPLGSGKLYFYESGTTTPKVTYADINLTIPNTNPVILTAAGRQPNIFFNGNAKGILTDKNDVQILVRDPIGETGTNFGDAWVATTIYSANSVVIGSDGVYYRSLANGNQNNNPTTTSGFWTLLYSVQWNAGITYDIGAVVTYDNQQYQSLQTSNLNQNPETQTAYWVGLEFAWIATATYSEDQNVVGTDGILYTSLQNSNTGNDPATSPAYWVGTSAAAAASATAAAASATAAAASETAAETAETNAAASETAAAASETAAAASESAAATSETNAANSASAASTSETNAAASETAAASSASAASTSETNAASSASAASTSETNAAASETAAAASETAAAASESAAATSETNAANSASAASTSASNASTSETNAAGSATAAASSATAAAGSATAAAGSATDAADKYDEFDDRYLGEKASDPTLDNDGNALITGALYFNTSTDAMKVYTGSVWQDVAPVATTVTLSQVTDFPSQSGQSGKYLSTNGTTPTWETLTTDPTLGTLTKTFTTGESSTINLTSSVLAPVVSVTKEVPQSGVTNNNWDVNSTTENYTRLNSAPATTLDWAAGDIDTASLSASFSLSGQQQSSSGISFSSDGTKMFTVGYNTDNVHQYSLSTAFDVSTASYDSVSFGVGSQESTPLSVRFNTSGTKMYVVGIATSTVYQYTLSSAWNLSTASYDSVSFDVSSQETGATSLFFNADGTKFYICGNGTITPFVYQYSLSTAFDIATASYDSVSFSVSSQDSSMFGLVFNASGTRMYLVGTATDNIYQYNLSTAFDISTASYSSKSFSVNSQDGSPFGLEINNSFLYVVGSNSNTVYQYTLLEVFTLGTGSFASADVGKTIEANSGAFVLTATDGSYVETTAPTSYAQVASGSWEMYGVVYNAAGGDLELSGYNNTFNIADASYDSVSFSVAAQDNNPKGIAFSTDGTKMFIVGSQFEAIYEYTLSTALNVSTASFVDSFAIDPQDTNPQGIAFSTDGTKMFVAGLVGRDINEYTLSTGFDVSTASFVDSFSVASQDIYPYGLAFNTDGTKMFFVGGQTNSVYQYALSTAFDVSTSVYAKTFSVSAQDVSPYGLAFNATGEKMFILGAQGDDVTEYVLSTGFDIATAVSSGVTFSTASQDATMYGFCFGNDGTKMYAVGNTDFIFQYSTGETPIAVTGYQPVHTTASIDTTYWTDINSMTADQNAGDGNVYYAISTDDRTTWTVIDNTDGERDIVRNNAGTWQYNSNGTYASETWTNATTNTELAALAEAMEGAESGYGLVNASYDSVSFSVTSQETDPRSVKFNSDGTKMFVTGESGDDVNEYTLSTAFDVSTASFVDSFSVASQETTPQGLAFNNDGTKMFVIGEAGDAVFEYNLSTGFDVSTASYSQSFSVSTQEAQPQAITFNSDGTKMFIAGKSGGDVNEYTLSTGFDVSTASFVDSFSVSGQTAQPSDVAFNSSGTVMFVLSASNYFVYEYSLSTAFDVSSASYSSVSFDGSNDASGARGLTFNTDGTKMYLVAFTSDVIYQFSTASYTNQMDKTQLDAVTDPNHIALSNDLDLSIIFNMTSGTTVPSSDGVAINYDANILNQGAVLGTDYNFDAPAGNKVRITAVNAANYKVRVV